MSVFYILVILAFTFVIVNFILDSKAPKTDVEAKLIDKLVESSVDANNIMQENYILVFNINNQKKMFNVSYTLVKDNLCEYNVKETISIAEKILKINPDKFEYPEQKLEL